MIGEDDVDADHFLVADADAAVAAAATAGATEVRRRRVLVVELARIGITATDILQRVAAIGAGIDLLYLTSNGALVMGIAGDAQLDEAMAALTRDAG